MKSNPLVAGVLAILLLVSMAGPAYSPTLPDQVAFMPEIEAINLPEGRGWYTILIERDDSVVDQWFESDHRLKNLRESTSWRKYKPDARNLTTAHHKAYGNDYPILVVQDNTGAVRAQITGSVIRSLQDADALVTLLDAACDKLRPKAEKLYLKVGWPRPWRQPDTCPGPNCPQPKPKPEPVQPSLTPVTPERPTPVLDWAIDRAVQSALASLLSGGIPMTAALAGAAGVLMIVRNRRKNKGR